MKEQWQKELNEIKWKYDWGMKLSHRAVNKERDLFELELAYWKVAHLKTLIEW